MIDFADNRPDVAELAAQLRVDSIRAVGAVGSGHVTSSLSTADLMAVLLLDYLRYDWENPASPTNDHLIFSKGHASPLLYAMWRAVGVVGSQELQETYRRLGSRLEGHPTPRLVGVDRLGQSGPTQLQWDLDTYPQRIAAFGVTPHVLDGHDFDAIGNAYEFALATPGATALIARTVKGCGVAEVVDRNGIVYLRTTRGAYPVLYPDADAIVAAARRLLGG